ncbi:hypothetical protein [Streptomyces sp. SJL17-4]
MCRRSWRLAPGPVLAVRGGHERVGRLGERFPVGQRQCSRVEEFVLG